MVVGTGVAGGNATDVGMVGVMCAGVVGGIVAGAGCCGRCAGLTVCGAASGFNPTTGAVLLLPKLFEFMG